ncbi:MAG: GHKL domain-containing protein [Eubacteriales bacterium]|nr:GHKL domain-containing protein [Eubacteriales bacterium]
MWFFSHFLNLAPSLLALVVNGVCLRALFGRFVQVRPKRLWRFTLTAVFSVTSGMVIWVGDNNLLLTLPVFLWLCLLCTQGDWVGRLAAAAIFFCLTMSVCALVDTYLAPDHALFAHLLRLVMFGGLWLLLRRRLPEARVSLPRRLWKLVLGLAMMPLCALFSTVVLGYYYPNYTVAQRLMRQAGLAVLPFVLVTSVVLLFTVAALADYQAMERKSQLAGLRELYYQGLRDREDQVRQLRHDLRNHLTAVQGLLDAGQTARAQAYLDRMAGSPILRGTRRLCRNETANVVLTAKAEAMAARGVAGHFSVDLPEQLPIADTDLAALLGNALDNALEAAAATAEKAVTVRCLAARGLLMLRVENPVSGPVDPSLATTKPGKQAHGFGLPGMREIAARYGGTLEAGEKNGRFELLVCLPLPEQSEHKGETT